MGTYNNGGGARKAPSRWIGSSSWAANRFLRVNGNGDLALNAMNWLSSDEDLISNFVPQAGKDRRITMAPAQLILAQDCQPICAASHRGHCRSDEFFGGRGDKSRLMNFRGLIVAVVILAGLGGVLAMGRRTGSRPKRLRPHQPSVRRVRIMN